MNAGPATCSLTRVITLHARHRYTHGGPTADHGHLYRIEVSVAGPLDPATQAVIDLNLLDQLLTEQLADRLGGRHLNEAVAEFASGVQQPSCEAFAVWCWQRLAPRIPPGIALQRVRVAEDSTLWADCTGVG